MKVTLRGDRAYEFMDRLITIVLPRLRDFAHGLAKENPDPDKKPAGPNWGDAWNMGYRLLFLCEYYMVTRDREIAAK